MMSALEPPYAMNKAKAIVAGAPTANITFKAIAGGTSSSAKGAAAATCLPHQYSRQPCQIARGAQTKTHSARMGKTSAATPIKTAPKPKHH